MLLRKELPASTYRPAGKQPRQQAECPQQRPASLPWFQDNRSSRVPFYLPVQIADPARQGEPGLGEPQHSQPFPALSQNGPAQSVGGELLGLEMRQRLQTCRGQDRESTPLNSRQPSAHPMTLS